MEQKMVKVPFDIELAKKITNGEIEGRIFDDFYKCSVRIVDFNLLSCKGKFNVAISERGVGKEVYSVFNDDGILYLDREDKLDEKPVFMLEIPEYMTFKDGDVLYARTGEFWYIYIYRYKDKFKTWTCAAIDEHNMLWLEDNHIARDSEISELRFATEEEKQKLINALKASKRHEAKEYLKLFFGIEQKQGYEFNFRDMVLVRSSEEDKWCAAEFSHKDGKWHAVFGGLCYEECIPYNEQTAHLIGTTDKWEE